VVFFVDVRDAVPVSIDGFFGLHGTVLTIPGDQHCRRQECGEQGRGEDPDLRVVIVGAALSEAQLRYEERNQRSAAAKPVPVTTHPPDHERLGTETMPGPTCQHPRILQQDWGYEKGDGGARAGCPGGGGDLPARSWGRVGALRAR
jgi:hypothetical protein